MKKLAIAVVIIAREAEGAADSRVWERRELACHPERQRGTRAVGRHDERATRPARSRADARDDRCGVAAMMAMAVDALSGAAVYPVELKR